MSQAPPAAVPVSRPGLFDYFLLLAGFALSSILLQLIYVPAQIRLKLHPSTPDISWAASNLWDQTLALLRLGDGVVLLWPLFLGIQRLHRRPQGLTVGEWLWVFSWLGTVLLLGLAAWFQWGTIPERISDYVHLPPLIWYAIIIPSMTVVAVVVGLLDVAGRRQQPWTHQLSLVLVSWPVLPLAALLATSKFS